MGSTSVKAESEWRHNVSVLRAPSEGGQVRWKGTTPEGLNRFLVMLEKRPGKPDHFYRSRSVAGSVADALSTLKEFREEFANAPSEVSGAVSDTSSVLKTTRKHPRLVQSGQETSKRYWDQQRLLLTAEAPPRPSAPVGFPTLKPKVKTRSGRTVDTTGPLWVVDRGYATPRRNCLNVDRLFRPWALGVSSPGGRLAGIRRRDSALHPELIHTVVLFLARTLERRTGGLAERILHEIVQFEVFLATRYPGQVFRAADMSDRLYRLFAADAGSIAGYFVKFYRWCFGQGFTGFEIQALMRLRRVPVESGVTGKAIRSSDPQKGALSWEEQRALTCALAEPTPETHSRDRLIVWLFQELGARPSAIGALKNRHLHATPLGDAYMLYVPRVKQSGPVRDLVPRKISKGLGNLIESMRVGSDDGPLIPGSFEFGWATKACRAFVAVNDLRSPRLVTRDAHGVEQHPLLPLNAYRLRYTMGTSLAEQGASPEQIAAMLDDRTLAMALVYTSNTSELVDILEETLDRHPAWLRQMNLFLGKVGGSENRQLPVIQGGVPYFENYEQYAHRISELGWCSSPKSCELRPPLACYRCGWFVAHPDTGVHLQQLDQLKDEVRTKIGVESDRMAKVLRPDMFAVAELVAMTRGGAAAGQRIETRIARGGAARGATESRGRGSQAHVRGEGLLTPGEKAIL